MTVAIVVSGLALALAAGLIVQSHRMAAQAALQIKEPDGYRPLRYLEAEIRSAIAVGPDDMGGEWSRDRLVVTLKDGRRAAYERHGTALVRRSLDSGTGSLPVHVVVRDLRSWRWRLLGPRAVAVEAIYERGVRPTGGVVTPRGRQMVERAPPATDRFVVALRAGGKPTGW
jgi:hypothetical protein